MAAAVAVSAAAPSPGDLMLTPFQQRYIHQGAAPVPMPPRKNNNNNKKRRFSDLAPLDMERSGAYDDDHEHDHALLDRIYRELNRDEHSLKFGSDTLTEGLPAKRARKSTDPGAGPETGAAALARPMRDHGTVSHGYGEFTRGAIDSFFDFLEVQAKEVVQKGDTFVDIGSGHGRVVLHAAARMGRVFSRVRGIEAVRARHEVATKTLAKLGDEFKALPVQVEFLCKDASEMHLGFDDHLFMYDYVFSERTHKAILPNITRFKTLTTTLTAKKLRKRGLDHRVHLVFKRSYRTTGGTAHTLYTYAPDVEITPVAENKEDTEAFMRGWQSEPEMF